jgi:hypothetical protein
MAASKTFDVEVTYTLKVVANNMAMAREAIEQGYVKVSDVLVESNTTGVKQLLINEENFAK